MSSHTAIHVEPKPTAYTVRDNTKELVSIDRILGAGGTALLRETLAQLPTIRSELGEEAHDVLNWTRAKAESDCYETTVNGIPIHLQLAGAVANLEYSQEYVVYDPANGPPTEQRAALDRAVTYQVNHLLAVAMGTRVSQRLKQYVGVTQYAGMRLQQVQQTNTLAVRVSAYSSRTRR